MVVGVNGVGKTTTIGKLAHRIKNDGNEVLICAADTFRAAANDQLAIWAERAGMPLIQQKPGTDPSAVLYDSLTAAKARDVDVLIVDTAGRLHTKANLMKELEKMRRVAERQVPGAPHEVLLVVDAVTGQNGLEQARQFTRAAPVTGLVLTKLDGTAKGGIVVTIVNELGIPIRYIGIGEQLDDLDCLRREAIHGQPVWVERMEPLLEVTRGNIVESLHRGAIAAVTPEGHLVASVGDVERICFLRSAAKPHQVLPFIASGGADRLGVTEAEIALMAGSHSGQRIHTDAVEQLLARVGLSEAALGCGSHAPFDDATRRALGDRAPGALHNNCSGKHTGMLAAAVDAGHPIATYLEPEHPVQRTILAAVSRFSGVAEDRIETGTDGCSAPIFAVSVRAQALMFARLVNPVGLGEDDARAARRISAAMVAHPEMVAATEGRLDTDLMRAGAGRLVAEAGAEGVYAMGIFPSKEYPDGLGVALKIEDGDPAGRARDPIVAEIVSQLLGLELALYARREIANRSGTVVGGLRPVFSLEQR